jgi:nucleotide-binding universal stress UspA family protein
MWRRDGLRRELLLAVAGLLTGAAVLAIAILLFGDFGGVEGRILSTTLSIAGFGALAVPAAILWDQERLQRLALGCTALDALAAALFVAAIWVEPGEIFGKVLATALMLLVPAVVVTALATRPLHRLFAPFLVLTLVVVAMATTAVWAEIERDAYWRVLGALLVLATLLLVLQPLLARAGRELGHVELRLVDSDDRSEHVVVRAGSVAEAASRAIRAIEEEGRSIRALEVLSPGLPGRAPGRRHGRAASNTTRGELRSRLGAGTDAVRSPEGDLLDEARATRAVARKEHHMSSHSLARAVDSAATVFGNVLVGIDGSPESLEAARQAAVLARPDAPLTLVAAWRPPAAVLTPMPALPVGPGSDQVLEKAAREALEQAKSQFPSARARVRRGAPTHVLLDEAHDIAATLVAVGSHGHRRATGMVFGSTATELVHSAPSSVLVARAGARRYPDRIAVGVDGSPASARAFAAARHVAERFGAELDVVVAEGDDLVDLAAISAIAGDGFHVLDDDPVTVLKAAADNADLLVVGSRGLRGLRALGSVSERVAHGAASSVLVVR